MSNKPPSDAIGFEPIDPWNSEYLSISRRNLPHLNVPGATYFITFRSTIELSPAARDVVFATILACNQKKIDLDAAVVMPDQLNGASWTIRTVSSGHSSRASQAKACATFRNS